MTLGKNICKQLKEVRKRIAEENDIPLEMVDCTYKGECPGTCPRCDAEVRYMENALAERLKLGKVATIAGLAVGLAVPGAAAAQDTISTKKINGTTVNQKVVKLGLVGTYTQGIIADQLKKLENIRADTLPTVPPTLEPARDTLVTFRLQGIVPREKNNYIKNRDSLRAEYFKDNGTPARQSVTNEPSKMYEDQEDKVKVIVR